ncbi:gibberellin-regulated-like protein, partial [Parasponia andersonii]
HMVASPHVSVVVGSCSGMVEEETEMVVVESCSDREVAGKVKVVVGTCTHMVASPHVSVVVGSCSGMVEEETAMVVVVTCKRKAVEEKEKAVVGTCTHMVVVENCIGKGLQRLNLHCLQPQAWPLPRPFEAKDDP